MILYADFDYTKILRSFNFEEKLKKRHINLAYRNSKNYTLFLYAAAHEEFASQLKVIAKNHYEEVAEQTVDLDNALNIAIQSNNYKGAKVLLECGFDVNNKSHLDSTIPPLFLACITNNEEMVNLLLDYNADTKREYDCNTPITYAIEHLSVNAVRALVKSKKDLNLDFLESAHGSALNQALWEDYDEIVHLLLKAGANLEITNEENESILRAPARLNNKVMLSYLIELGADINKADIEEGETTLMYICKHGTLDAKYSYDMVKLLVLKGANLFLRDKAGYTAMGYALRSQNLQIIKYLKNKGLNTIKEDSEGLPFLFQTENAEFLDFLLQEGADINRKLKTDKGRGNAEKGEYEYEILYYHDHPTMELFEVMQKHQDKMEPALKEVFESTKLQMLLFASKEL